MAYNEYSNSGGTYDGTELVGYPGYPEFDRAEGSRSIVYKYWCKTSLAHDGTGGLIPARFSTIVYEGYTYYLSDAKSSPQANPTMSDVTLNYNRTGSKSEPIRSDGDIERSIEPIILTKREVKAVSDSEVDKPEAEIWGLEYELTHTKENFDWSEDNIINSFVDNLPMTPGENAGEGILPYGIPPEINGVVDPFTNADGATFRRWIFASLRLRETPRQATETGYTPATTTIVERWLFSPMGWKDINVPEA